MTNNPETPHSEMWLGDHRDLWWNQDYLELLAKRFQLHDVKVMADIGAGKGHWTKCLIPFLDPLPKVTCIDREADWVSDLKQNFPANFSSIPSENFEFLQGDVLDLPLESESCDLVTCQTLLMHVSDPMKALAEMKRVVKPGGLILCVESMNLFNRLEMGTLTPELDIKTQTKEFEAWLAFHRSKIELGEGDHDIASYLPKLFMDAGLKRIRTYQNDCVVPDIPGVVSEEELDFDYMWPDVDDMVDKMEKTGYEQAQISEYKKALKEISDASKEAMRKGSYVRSGGMNMFIVAGYKV